MILKRTQITSITSLEAARGNKTFEINWSYIGSPTAYKVYRYVGAYPVDSNKDPATDYATGDFVLIATKTHPTTSCTDNINNNLNLNGFTLVNGIWRDSNGRNVINDIFETKRPIYYKVVATESTSTTEGIHFNAFPFVFIGDNSGYLTCVSTITQVKFNRLRSEGEAFWREPIAGSKITNIAVDSNFIDREPHVWVTAGKVAYRVKIADGSISQRYTFTYNLYSVRILPSGDAIVGGVNQTLAKCYAGINESREYLGSTSLSTGTHGAYGMSIIKSNNKYLAYTIWDKHYVIYWDVTSINGTAATIIPQVNYVGAYGDIASQYNVWGITTSPNQNIFTTTRESVWVQENRICNADGPGVTTDYTYCPEGAYCAYLGNEPNHSTGCDEPGYYSVCPVEGGGGYDYACPVDHYFLSDEGWVRKMPNGTTDFIKFTDCGRPGHNSYPCVGNGFDDPDPNIKSDTYDGLQCDIATDSLLGSNFKIWQSNAVENYVHKINGDLSEPELNTITVTNPYDVAVDSENNIWALSREGDHKKYNQGLIAGSTFPTGIDCLWPKATNMSLTATNWDYGAWLNDAYIEYVLTRNISDTITQAITAAENNTPLQRQLAVQWISVSGLNHDGRYVYSNTTNVGLLSTLNIPRHNATPSYHPNSDETGIESFYLQIQDPDYGYTTLPDHDHPDPTYATFDLWLTPTKSTPVLEDDPFWNDLRDPKEATLYNVSGYDDLTVQFEVSNTNVNSHTFEILGYNFGYGDKIIDKCGDVKCICSNVYPQCGDNPADSTDLYGKRVTVNTTVVSYKYHDPSENGKPSNRWHGAPGETGGTYMVDVTGYTNPDCYVLSGYLYGGNEYETKSPQKNVYVWERWPTAEFYVTPINVMDCVPAEWNTTAWPSWLQDVGDNGLDQTDENRIVSGYDPLSATFTDFSIARTWPMSSWHWTFGDKLTYGGFVLPPANCESSHVINETVIASNANYHPRDSQTVHENMVAHVYKGPGTYWATLWVQASNTNTDSWNISAGVTAYDVMNNTFTIAASRRIDVLEACPISNFWLVSGMTVPSDYSDLQGSFFDTGLNGVPAFIRADNQFISGYAPNLTVTWQGSVTARSRPLSAIVWDFNDYYNDSVTYTDSWGTNRDNRPQHISLYNPPDTGWPLWTATPDYNDPQYTITTHTFIMPGYYDVTLNLKTSSANYTETCETCTKQLHVYVEEIPLTACFMMSNELTSGYSFNSISGISPLTIYFNPSCTEAGSFRPCRIDWDFGDDSNIYTVSRAITANYLYTEGLTAYPMDLLDPRNIIVNHTYTRTPNMCSIMISMSAYACNTNTMSIATGLAINIEDFDYPPQESLIGDVHLINNRMYNNDNDLLLIFESDKKQTFNVMLSA